MNALDRRRGRLRNIVPICLCMWAGTTLAETRPTPQTWLVSGEELARLLEGKGDDGLCAEELCRHLSSARAGAYVQGVADAIQGQWCGHGQVLPHELVDRVFSYIRQLPSSRLKQDASDLVIEGLRTGFPCHQGSPDSKNTDSKQMNP